MSNKTVSSGVRFCSPPQYTDEADSLLAADYSTNGTTIKQKPAVFFSPSIAKFRRNTIERNFNSNSRKKKNEQLQKITIQKHSIQSTKQQKKRPTLKVCIANT